VLSLTNSSSVPAHFCFNNPNSPSHSRDSPNHRGNPDKQTTLEYLRSSVGDKDYQYNNNNAGSEHKQSNVGSENNHDDEDSDDESVRALLTLIAPITP